MLYYSSIRELNWRFQQGILTPIELTETILQKANQVEVGILLDTFEAQALEEAKASTKRWQQQVALGLFDGIPCVWKDLFDVKGSVTTAGSKAYQNRPEAFVDAPIVAAYKKCGGINIGKAGLSELAYSGLGINPAFGTPINPFDQQQQRIPGGSSSGSAAAVSAELCAFSMGSDTSGSIRIPSAFHHLVGYKPSQHRFNQNQVFPLSTTLDEIGPIAKSVQDCFDVTNLFLNRAPALLDNFDLSNQTFIVPSNVVFEDIDASVLQRFQDVCLSLQDHGAKIIFKAVPELETIIEAIRNHGTFAAAESFYYHQPVLASETGLLIDQRVLDRMYRAKTMLASDYVALLDIRKHIIAQMAKTYQNSIFLMPTVVINPPLLAPLLDSDELFHQTNVLVLRNTSLFNFTDSPSISIPMPLGVEGLPAGLMLSALSGEDDGLFPVAHAVERVLAKMQ